MSFIFGAEHELEGLIVKGQPWNEAMMDLHNNAEGRAAAREKRDIDLSRLQVAPKETIQMNPYEDTEK